MKRITSLIKIFPFIGVLLIFSGYLKLYFFYDNWNIKASEYLDISEILISFLNDLDVILIFAIIFLLEKGTGILTFNSIGASGESNSLIAFFENRIVKIIIIISQTIFGVLFYFVFLSHYRIFPLYFTVVALFGALFAFLDFFIDEIISLIVSAIFGVLFLSYLLSMYDINGVNNNRYLTRTTIVTEYDTIVTSNDHYLIGKTKEHIFLYDDKKHCSEVIPSSCVKKIITRKR